MKILNTSNAPAAVGPYSQGVDAGELIFLSGQLGINPEGQMQEGLVAQTHQSFKNIQAVLASEGLDFSNIVKLTVFLADIADFQAMNEVYAEYIKEPFPARSAYAVKGLPLGGLVEIEVIAKR